MQIPNWTEVGRADDKHLRQQTNEYYRNEDKPDYNDHCMVTDYKGDQLNYYVEPVWRITDGGDFDFIFSEDEAIQFYEDLVDIVGDPSDLLKIYGRTIEQLKLAVNAGEFARDKRMPMLKFLGAFPVDSLADLD